MINIYIVHGQKHSQCPFNTAILYNLLRFSNAMVLFFSVATSNENGMDWIGCSMRSGTTHKIYVFDFIHHVDRCTNTIMRYDPHKIESNRTVSQRYTKLRHEITTLIDATSDRKIVTPWHAQADKDE